MSRFLIAALMVLVLATKRGEGHTWTWRGDGMTAPLLGWYNSEVGTLP